MKTSKTKHLYRERNGKIAGVCGGIAEYFGLEKWLVRILTITAFFLLAGPFVVVSYIAAWFILDVRPREHGDRGFSRGAYVPNGFVGSADDEARVIENSKVNASKIEVKSRVWQAGEPPRQAFFDIQQRFKTTEAQLQRLETYVTSKEFQLNREISRL